MNWFVVLNNQNKPCAIFEKEFNAKLDVRKNPTHTYVEVTQVSGEEVNEEVQHTIDESEKITRLRKQE